MDRGRDFVEVIVLEILVPTHVPTPGVSDTHQDGSIQVVGGDVSDRDMSGVYPLRAVFWKGKRKGPLPSEESLCEHSPGFGEMEVEEPVGKEHRRGANKRKITSTQTLPPRWCMDPTRFSQQ